MHSLEMRINTPLRLTLGYACFWWVPLLALLMACSPPDAPDPIITSVSGRVIDARSLAPLPGTILRTEPPSEQVAANENGAFRLVVQFTSPEINIVADRAGYLTARSTVRVQEGLNVLFDVVMTKVDDSSCSDGVVSIGETDRDCGGPCRPCQNEQRCVRASDCESGICLDGICASNCPDPRRTGAQCTECLPRFTGVNCDLCTSNRYAPPDCLECSGGWRGPDCDRCADNWQGDDCDQCANGWSGTDCLTCPPNFEGPNCDQCAQGWIGTDCDICPPQFGGNNCDECAEGRTGENCSRCSDDRFAGEECTECRCENLTGADCDECAPGWGGYDNFGDCNCPEVDCLALGGEESWGINCDCLNFLEPDPSRCINRCVTHCPINVGPGWSQLGCCENGNGCFPVERRQPTCR